ncbi:hypothetical protein MKS88_004080 [Plasmodium brasilianum]|uniref:GRIP domain-containing protein n=2 Tax=Plasmodium (Plasmodium) TaxID=418103 RepID=A0A1D3SNU2_PLAMA|nr:conserved Plasmodium protein, unknown function [Plasmodium malariae]KAI4836290.1 hypothetical protein MKS88_004080 [Plasmodium brasilianum]SCO93553.1 conserved Plasmodium protein, unknown function [Plasmodium malariae]
MDDFLIKLKKISEQYNNLLLEKKIIDKRITNIEENIHKYEETKQKSLKEVELKKNQLLKNKNKHLIKCQKMEELNNKLNEILIRKQRIDDEEEKNIIKKQIDTVNKTYTLLNNVQKLNDTIVKDNNNYYKLITQKIHNNNFSNKKTLNILNCFLNKNRATILEKDNEHNAFPNNFKMIQTNDTIQKLIHLFSNDHTSLTLEKQQFLFVLLMNVLKKIFHMKEKVIHDENKSNEVIHNFLYNNYILLQ